MEQAESALCLSPSYEAAMPAYHPLVRMMGPGPPVDSDTHASNEVRENRE